MFDPEKLKDKATFEDAAQLSEGIEKVWVSGVLIFESGILTGNRPGRVIRRKG